jgi:hypothetical protein
MTTSTCERCARARKHGIVTGCHRLATCRRLWRASVVERLRSQSAGGGPLAVRRGSGAYEGSRDACRVVVAGWGYVSPVYDRIEAAYASTRRPDPRIAAVIAGALAGARSVVNVGAGVGSYGGREL